MKSLIAVVLLSLELAACGAPTTAPSGAPGSTRASASAAESALTPLNVSYSQATVSQGALFTGVDQGFFRKNGLDVSIKQVGGTAQIPALLAGEVQISGVGASEVAMANLGGAQLAVIATALDLPLFSLYADKKYKTVQDLAGQTIGVTTAGSSSDSFAKLTLRHYNLRDQVKISPAGGTPAAVLAAVVKGGIAAGVMAPPTTEQAAKEGLIELVNGFKLGIPMNQASIATTRDNIQNRRDVLLRFLRGYQQAWTFNADAANESVVIKTLAKHTQTDEASVRPGYQQMLTIWQGSKMPAMNPEALGNILKLSDDPKAAAANPNDFIDGSLLQAIRE